MSADNFAEYKTRPIRYLHQREHMGWRVKVYGIRHRHNSEIVVPDVQLVENAMEKVLPNLPQPAITDSRYGVAFLIIHQGEHRNWILLDWWSDEVILKQRLYSSPIDDPNKFTEDESNILACTWEMAIQCFERNAWVETVLKGRDGVNLDAYLERQMNEDF